MNKLLNYFLPENENIYFNKLKTIFLIRICFVGITLLAIYIFADFVFRNDNFWISLTSKLVSIIYLFVSLFVLKNKGVKIAGNIFTTTGLIILLFFINIIPKDIIPTFKFIQGFYSIFVYLTLGVLYSTRPFIIFNSAIVLFSTTRVLIKTLEYFPDDVNLYISSYINHSAVVLVMTAIVFYANKFALIAIIRAEEENKANERKNQELLTSEEELRASNEELVATTDALVAANDNLRTAKNKAEESDRLKTEFLNNMSHEVRTPMNGIVGFSQLLNEPDMDKKTIHNYTTIIQNSSMQLLSIIDNIIEISRLGTKQVQVFNNAVNLNKFLANIFAIFKIKANANNVGFILNSGLDDEACNIMVDELKLYSVLSNLLDNAIKFTHDGKVELSYTIVSMNKTDSIRFVIADNGIGIDGNKHQLIFEKFRQANEDLARQYGGLGLGLSIAKENVELMGGGIELESEPGKGCTFYITIPLEYA